MSHEHKVDDDLLRCPRTMRIMTVRESALFDVIDTAQDQGHAVYAIRRRCVHDVSGRTSTHLGNHTFESTNGTQIEVAQ